ncbi:MAG: PilT/PilU family type 4a pilus ATPase [bacterium]
MNAVDSLLSLLAEQGGTELRFVADQRPQMFNDAIELPLTMPAMSAARIRGLLGELWTANAAALQEGGRLSFSHDSGEHGRFVVRVSQDDASGLRVSFRRDSETQRRAETLPPHDVHGARMASDGASSAAAAPSARGAPAPDSRRLVPGTQQHPTHGLIAPDAGVRREPGDGGYGPAAGGGGPSAARVDGDAQPGDGSSESGASAVGVAAALPAELVALLARAVERGASDLHLSPGRAPILRVDGGLEVLAAAAGMDAKAGFDAAALLADPGQVEQVRSRGSVDRACDVPGGGRIRVNVYASDEGLCAAVRILRREAPGLAELNLPAQVEALVGLPHGLIIACGPTGSGKSTTLAALVQHALRTRPQVLVTLEDPIEYLIRPMQPAALVRQREIGTHVLDFASGLRDALREDPDLLLIGEMRDAETISLALTAAETGHLVFASLHSRTALSAVERIVDTYPPERQRQIRVQLADSLRAVISQRLLPRADGDGRVAAVELLRVTHGVANLIREGRTAQIVNALQAGGGDGMLLLERHLADLVRAKRIRRDTALAGANDAAALQDYLRGA